jgi:Protein of unknown function (DUF3443)
MAVRRTAWLVAIPVLAFGCSGGSGGKETPDSGPLVDGGGTTPEGSSPPVVDNVAPMVVNAGPPGTLSVDVPFVSITICVPGTTQCQTIDYVSVDTGSQGLRIISSVLSKSIALPQAKATTGSALAECYTFDDGYTWGSVRLADVKIAGEVATKIPIQIIGDPDFTSVPGDCSSTGPSEDTVADFGGNGIIGINQIVADCGDCCSDPGNIETGAYYSCSGSNCTAVAVADDDQVSNPIAFFGADNNGVVMQFPAVAAAGATMLSGSLIFGIGTAKNNDLGSAKVLTVDDNGNFSTIYKGKTLDTSFLDSGTSLLSFNDSSIPQCSGSELNGYYCPASPLSLTAQNVGRNGVTSTVTFSVESTATLFGNCSYDVFDDLAGTGLDNTSFDWGFPFFIGRAVYVALQGATTPGGKGPYFAY